MNDQPPARTCGHCEKRLPPESRANRKYCSPRCRQAARRHHRDGPKQQATPQRVATEVVLLGLVPIATGIVINVATELGDNMFMWAIVVAAAVTASGLTYRLRRGTFSPGPPWAAAAICAFTVLILVGAFAYERVRTPPSSCIGASGEQVSMQADPRTGGRIWTKVYKCPKSSSARVFERPTFDAPIIGTLDPGVSWVVCWLRGDDDKIWYYTQGDDRIGRNDYRAWGFIPGGVLQVAHQPDSAVSHCPPQTAHSP